MKYLSIVLLLLAGCATSFSRPGGLETEFANDVVQCSMLAEYHFTHALDGGFTYRPSRFNQENIDACLRARGWK